MKVSYYNHEFVLLQTSHFISYSFSSAIDKNDFIRTNKRGTYFISKCGNFAQIKTYSVFDPEYGFCLNNSCPLSFNDCMNLIHMYC